MTTHRDFDFHDGQLVERQPGAAPSLPPAPQQELFSDLRRSFFSSFTLGDRVRVITHGGLFPAGCLPTTPARDCYGLTGTVERVEPLDGGAAYSVHLEDGLRVRVGPGALELAQL